MISFLNRTIKLTTVQQAHIIGGQTWFTSIALDFYDLTAKAPVIYGFRRSSFVMGVHPGCFVLSIVAVSLVAVETDVGETISATKVMWEKQSLPPKSHLCVVSACLSSYSWL